jgi:hypothetical protein
MHEGHRLFNSHVPTRQLDSWRPCSCPSSSAISPRFLSCCWPSEAVHRISPSYVRRHSAFSCTQHRHLSAARTPSHDLARDIPATHGRIRPTTIACQPWSAQAAGWPGTATPRPPSTAAGLAMPVAGGAPRPTSLPSATRTSTRLGGSGSDAVLVVQPAEDRPAAHLLRRHGPDRRQPTRSARRLPAKPAMRPPMVVA